MRRLLRLALLLCLPAAVQAQTLPRAPQQPTQEDCRQLSVAFYDITRRIHQQISQCLRSPTSFGYGKACSLSSPYTVRQRSLTAWVHCDVYEEPLCQAYAARDAEMATCNARVAQRQRIDQEATDRLKRANDTTSGLGKAWGTARGLLSNPYEFFFNSAIAQVTRTTFPTWRGEVDLASDPRAQEMYRFMQNMGNATFDTTGNPVIRSIQKESFLQILAHFKRMTLQLNQATDAIEKFSVNTATAPRRAPAAPPPAPTDNSHRPIEGLCQQLGTCQ